MLNMKRLSFILCGILFFAVYMAAQNGAQISADELTYNFGTIAEADGLASHTFEIKNTGDGPLVITRVTASYATGMDKRAGRSGKNGQCKSNLQPQRSSRPFL